MNIVILASARGDSNTLKAVRKLCPFSDYVLIDLREKRIGHYEYNHQTNVGDDFLEIAITMKEADNIVFATPVYWYAMSGLMKVFFDRLTELLSNHKTIGEALNGKKTYLISTGSDPILPDGFEVPFRSTSKYFDMEFQKSFYLQFE
jgi:multimeric flavodoxin WrbA